MTAKKSLEDSIFNTAFFSVIVWLGGLPIITWKAAQISIERCSGHIIFGD